MNLIQPHLSFSAINQFATCPRSWFSQRVLGKKQKAGEAASFGLAFEAQVTEALGAKNEKEQTEEDKNRAILTEPQAIREVAAAKEKYLTSPGSWVDKAPDSLVAQRKIEITPEQWGTLADCYEAAGEIHLPIIGYIDLLHTDSTRLKRTVNDLKTTTRTGLQYGWFAQTTLYCLAERAQKLEIQVLIRPADRPTKKPRPENWLPNFQTAFYSFYPTQRTFQWAMTWIGANAAQMRLAEKSSLERLPACPSYACTWCPEKDACEPAMLMNLAPSGGSKAGMDSEEV